MLSYLKGAAGRVGNDGRGGRCEVRVDNDGRDDGFKPYRWEQFE